MNSRCASSLSRSTPLRQLLPFAVLDRDEIVSLMRAHFGDITSGMSAAIRTEQMNSPCELLRNGRGEVVRPLLFHRLEGGRGQCPSSREFEGCCSRERVNGVGQESEGTLSTRSEVTARCDRGLPSSRRGGSFERLRRKHWVALIVVSKALL